MWPHNATWTTFPSTTSLEEAVQALGAHDVFETAGRKQDWQRSGWDRTCGEEKSVPIGCARLEQAIRPVKLTSSTVDRFEEIGIAEGRLQVA